MSSSLYNNADSNYHLAAQFFALIGKNLVKPQPDDSHNTCQLDPGEKVLLGRPFSRNDRTFQLGLDINAFSLFTQLPNSKRTTTFDLDKRCVADLREWVKSIIRQFNGKKSVDDSLHYDLPQNFFSDDRLFEKPTNKEASAWIDLRTQANKAMTALNERFDKPSEVNIWPHHFDTGAYFPIKSDGSEVTSSVGAGLAIADKLHDGPYYYIYGWAKDNEVDFTNAPPLSSGRWETNDWKGALLPIGASSPSWQEVGRFYKEASDFFKAQIA